VYLTREQMRQEIKELAIDWELLTRKYITDHKDVSEQEIRELFFEGKKKIGELYDASN
jgi:hypothetical protein